MTEYARVECGTVIEFRTMPPPPVHKAYLWHPVVREGEGPVESRIIEADRVRVIRSDLPLSEIKSGLVTAVKTNASAARSRFATPGKDMVYAEKKDQAHAVLQMGPDAANALPNNGAATFPLLSATVGIDAATLHDVAAIVWQKYEAWNVIGAAIERTEVLGCKLIGDASNAAAARAAYEAITWPTP